MPTFLKRHQKAVIWAIIVSFVIGAGGLISLDRSGVFDKKSSDTASRQPTFAATIEGSKISLEALSARTTQLKARYTSLYQQAGLDPTTIFSGAAGAWLTLRLESGALSDLIREVIYVQEAKTRGIKVSDAAIDAEVQKQYDSLLTSNGISEAQLTAYLDSQGKTLAGFKAEMRAAVVIQLTGQALDAEVGAGPAPTEDEVAAYFEKNLYTKYDVTEQVHAQHILVADLATAQSIKKELDAGADFATLAAQYSTDTGTKNKGGDLGWFGHEQMVQQFEDAAFSLDPGQTSDPVKTQYGYHIIRVLERREARTPTLAEVHDQVVADLTADNQTTRAQDWYTATRKAKKVVIGIPTVNAFMVQEQNLDLGLAEFERLLGGGTGTDPYIAYYVGQIYEQKGSSAATEQATLEAVTSPTAEQTARIEQLKAAQKEDKDKALAAYLTLIDKDVVDEALLTKILTLDPQSTKAMLAMGRLLAEKGDSTGAQSRYTQILAVDPQSVDALMASAQLAEDDRNYALARQRYEQLLGLRPNDVTYELRMVTILLALGDNAAAEAMTQAVRKTAPQTAQLVVAEGDVAKAKLEVDVAARDGLLARPKRTATEEAEIAALNKQVNDLYQTAVARYQAALQAASSLDLSVKLAQAYRLGGKLDDAERELQTVLSRSPYRADAYEELAKISLERGDETKAIEQLRTALARSFDWATRTRLAEEIVQLDPTDTATGLRLAKLYSDVARWAAAVREYDQLIAIDPSLEEAYSGIAKAYAAQVKSDSALEYLRRGVAAVKQDAAKIRLYQQIVDVDQADVGTGKPLSSAGLDALIEIAKLDIPRGDKTDARAKLTQVQTADPKYRAAEVKALLDQVGGAATSTPAAQ